MKRYIYILVLVISILFNYSTIEAKNINEAKDYKLDNKEVKLNISSKNVILYNLTDNYILYSKDSDKEVQIASLTKIMTAIISIENIKNLDDIVTLDYNVFQNIEEYTQVGFRAFDKVTYRDLLYGLMLPSGADAAQALVLNTTKSKEEFIKLMNKKVSDLGLKHTKFDNVIGMDSNNNYSSAHDLAIILDYALQNPEFKKIFTAKDYTIKSINKKIESTLTHYGKGIDTSIITGAKSGFTDNAGVSLASISDTKDTNYLLIVLGANPANRSNAIKDTIEIYKYYINNYSHKTITNKNQVLKKLNVKWGKEKTYSIKSNEDIIMYLNNEIDIDKIEYKYTGIDELNYKIKKGNKLGKIDTMYNETLLNSKDIYLDQDIFYYHPIIYTIIVISIILLIALLKLKNKKKKRRKRRRRKR